MKQSIDGVIETVITDEALHLAHEKAEPFIDECVIPALSKSVQEAFKRAKKASATQNAGAGRIVAEMRERRENTNIDEGCLTSYTQTTLFDHIRTGRE